MLFLIRFLHQTTTFHLIVLHHRGCFLFDFYIKPQRSGASGGEYAGCFLFDFYIKPQREIGWANHRPVVSYSISTSNHNRLYEFREWCLVVSYSISTSNHNLGLALNDDGEVVSYSISTSNHNHQNHQPKTLQSCFLFDFYIKPQHQV